MGCPLAASAEEELSPSPLGPGRKHGGLLQHVILEGNPARAPPPSPWGRTGHGGGGGPVCLPRERSGEPLLVLNQVRLSWARQNLQRLAFPSLLRVPQEACSLHSEMTCGRCEGAWLGWGVRLALQLVGTPRVLAREAVTGRALAQPLGFSRSSARLPQVTDRGTADCCIRFLSGTECWCPQNPHAEAPTPRRWSVEPGPWEVIQLGRGGEWGPP